VFPPLSGFESFGFSVPLSRCLSWPLFRRRASCAFRAKIRFFFSLGEERLFYCAGGDPSFPTGGLFLSVFQRSDSLISELRRPSAFFGTVADCLCALPEARKFFSCRSPFAPLRRCTCGTAPFDVGLSPVRLFSSSPCPGIRPLERAPRIVRSVFFLDTFFRERGVTILPELPVRHAFPAPGLSQVEAGASFSFFRARSVYSLRRVPLITIFWRARWRGPLATGRLFLTMV